MFLTTLATGAFEANCYVLATRPGTECVIVDPGQDAIDPIRDLCRKHDLTPAGVLATHGHLDHVLDAAAVCREWSVPCWIHPADRHLLTEPHRGLPEAWRPLLDELLGGSPLLAPEVVESYPPVLTLAGLEFTVLEAPGHSAGSVVLQLTDQLVLTGDVIFAGSIGRTDLPGSDPAAMERSLAMLCATLPRESTLLPGHGAATTMAAELDRNPYLPVR